MADEEIKNIIIEEAGGTFLGIFMKTFDGGGAVPKYWSWEIPNNKDMPPKAFLLYVENPDFVEMRQIYVARRHIRKGLGREILKEFENLHKGKLVKIFVRFTDHDPDNIFHDFLVSQEYKADTNKPESLWIKQL